jgi:hypothetical protein
MIHSRECENDAPLAHCLELALNRAAIGFLEQGKEVIGCDTG